MLTVGSLFAGYGGIELALSSVLDVRPAWFVEFAAALRAFLWDAYGIGAAA